MSQSIRPNHGKPSSSQSQNCEDDSKIDITDLVTFGEYSNVRGLPFFGDAIDDEISAESALKSNQEAQG